MTIDVVDVMSRYHFVNQEADMNVQLHEAVRHGSEKARIWKICDELYAKRGAPPSGREVAKIYLAQGGDNEGTARTQCSRWKKELARRLPVAPPDGETGNPEDYVPLTVSADGAVTLPASMRVAMMLDDDGRVTARVVDGELRLISPRAALRQVQRLIAERDAGTGSAVDELIAERRAEAQRESRSH